MDSGPHHHQRGLAGTGLHLVTITPLLFASDWFRSRQVAQFCPVRHERQLLGLLIKRDKKGKILHFAITANASGPLQHTLSLL